MRVIGHSLEELDTLREEFDPLVERALTLAVTQVAENLTTQGLTAGAEEDAFAISHAWNTQVSETLLPHIAAVFDGASLSVAYQISDGISLGEGVGIPMVPPDPAVAYLSQANNRLKGVGDDVWQHVRDQLVAGVQAGESIEQLALRVHTAGALSLPRARVVARTEVNGASNAGAYAQLAYLGMAGVQEWLATDDGRTREDHALADGQKVPLDGVFMVGGWPLRWPGDPSAPASETVNCVVGSTYVDAPLIEVAMRSWFDGELIELSTATGKTLSVTPNHPVLTTRGWLPACELKVSDYVVCGDVRGQCSFGETNEQRAPTQISEIFDLTTQSSLIDDTKRVADFHGEWRECEIHVVAEDRKLGLEVVPASDEEITKFGFTATNLASSRTCSGDGGTLSLGITGRLTDQKPSSCLVSDSGDGSVLLDRSLSSQNSVSLDSSTPLKSSLTQDCPDGGARNTELSADTKDGFTLSVKLDEIIFIDRTPWRGHVYNLSTTGGWYTGNSIITGNCRCTVAFDLLPDPPSVTCDALAVTAATSHLGGYIPPKPKSTTVSTSNCIVPPSSVPTHADTAKTDALSASELDYVYKTFMYPKQISPAYGGAKIHKQMQATLDALAKTGKPHLAALGPQDIIHIVDQHYKQGKYTFKQKYDEWLSSKAGVTTTPHQAVKTTPDGVVKSDEVPGKIATTKTSAVDVGVKVDAVTEPVATVSKPTLTPTTSTKPPPPTVTSVAAPAEGLTKLPPVPPLPKLSELKYTGQTLGSHGAQVWVDVSGGRWLFKPQTKMLTAIDRATAQLQSKALQTRPGVYEVTLNGKQGSLQSMFESKAAFPGGFDPLKLTTQEITQLQSDHIFDWLIGNHDAHQDQFIRVGGDIVAIDKGQAFKFFSTDKLDWKWQAPGNFGTPIYDQMWRAFASGKDITLFDPTTGALGEFIKHLQSIPDAAYKDILRPYAKAAKTAGKLAYNDVELFLNAATARKNNLGKDFEALYQRALQERAKSTTAKTSPTLTPTPPKPTPVTPEVKPTATTDPEVSAPVKTDKGHVPLSQQAGDITAIPELDQEAFYTAFKKYKVTAVWSGSKIWEALQKTRAEGFHFNELEALKILDKKFAEHGGSTGYVDKAIKWEQSPVGKKQLGELPAGVTVTPSPTMTEVTAPVTVNVVMPGPKPTTPTVDVSSVPASLKHEMLKMLNSAGPMLTKPPTTIYKKVVEIREHAKKQGHVLSDLDVLRILDAEKAAQIGVTNAFLFEKKIVEWLKTPSGKATAKKYAAGVPKPASTAGYTSPTITSTGPTPSAEKLNADVASTVADARAKISTTDTSFPDVSVADAHKLQAEMVSQGGEWTTSQKASLRYYTSNNYTAMNKYLRGKSSTASDTVVRHIKNAQAGMRPSTKPVTVYRGTGFSQFGGTQVDSSIVGKIFEDKGFMSTSVGGHAAFGGQVLLQIECPTGTPMAFVKSISHYQNENEMLLAAGTKYRVMSVKTGSGKTIVRVRVVPG